VLSFFFTLLFFLSLEPEVVYGILGALLGVFIIVSIMFFMLWRQAKTALLTNEKPMGMKMP